MIVRRGSGGDTLATKDVIHSKTGDNVFFVFMIATL